MPQTDDPIADADVGARYAAGTLLWDISEEDAPHQPNSLRTRAIASHNAGDIDLLALTGSSEIESAVGHRYFLLQRVFCDVIPALQATVDDMSTAVVRLVDKAGSDGTSDFPYAALGQWLEKDLTRAETVVSAAKTNGAIDRGILMEALKALRDIDVAIALLTFAGDRQLAAIVALGQIDPRSDPRAETMLKALLPLVQSGISDARCLATISSISILRHAPALGVAWIPILIRSASHEPTDQIRVALLQAIWRDTQLFQAADIKYVLDLARTGDLASVRLSNVLGIAISRLFGGPHNDLALDTLTELLSAENSPLTLEKWQPVQHALATGDKARLFALAVSWFRTRNPRLCRAVADIIRSAPPAAPFDCNLARFGLTGKEQVVLCHKAIAYLFVHPSIAASFVVAALRARDSQVRKELIDLLVHPILRNFQGEARNYLFSIPRGDPAYSAVRKALKENDAYVKAVSIQPPIKELAPSTDQRYWANLRRRDWSRQIRKDAERQSVLLSLVRRSTILYGRGAMSYVGGLDKPPVTMDLHPISHSIELPQLSSIDPVGLDWLLNIFAASKPL